MALRVIVPERSYFTKAPALNGVYYVDSEVDFGTSAPLDESKTQVFLQGFFMAYPSRHHVARVRAGAIPLSVSGSVVKYQTQLILDDSSGNHFDGSKSWVQPVIVTET